MVVITALCWRAMHFTKDTNKMEEFALPYTFLIFYYETLLINIQKNKVTKKKKERVTYNSLKTSPNGNSTLVSLIIHSPPYFLSPIFSFEEMLHISLIIFIREEEMRTNSSVSATFAAGSIATKTTQSFLHRAMKDNILDFASCYYWISIKE